MRGLGNMLHTSVRRIALTTYGLDPCWTNNRNVRSALAPSSSHVLIFRAKMKSCGRRIENFVSL